MYEDEKQTIINYLAVKIRKTARKEGYISLNEVELKMKIDDYMFDDFLRRNQIDKKEVIKQVACSDIIRAQYKRNSWGKDGKPDNLWYYDPDRDTHLIEEISGIGPDDNSK